MKKLQLLVAVVAAAAVSIVRLGATTLSENFSGNPLQDGWALFGDTNLFEWDSTYQNLKVTFDSSYPNSYFYHGLGTILARDDDFSVAFDLQLDDVGPADSFPYSFEFGIGFLNLGQAIQPGFLRGTGTDSPNLVEFDYFREDPFGDPATCYPTLVGTNFDFNYNPGFQNSTNYALVAGDRYRISLTYSGSNQTLALLVANLSGISSAAVTQAVNHTFSDFRVDTVSISSYSDADQFPDFDGSILAHGIMDNLTVVLPPPPVRNLSGAFHNGTWQVQFLSRTNWIYALERTPDFQSWSDISEPASGTGLTMILQDASPGSNNGFYRIRANRP